MTHDNDNDDYKVGYRKPPKANQFKKGQSGNPSGRPKNMKTEKDHLNDVLGKEYVIQGPDGPVKVDGLGVIVRRIVKDAAEGKVGATKTLFARIDANGIGATSVQPELSEADQELAIILLKKYGALFAPEDGVSDHDH